MSRSSFWVPAGLFAFAGVAAFTLIGPARADTKSFNQSGFDGVAAHAGVNVVLKQGPYSVSADGGKREIDSLEILMEGSTLRVGHKQNLNWFGHWGPLTVTVTAPSFKSVSASGGADVVGSDLKAANFTVSASGGGDVTLSGSLGDVDAKASGGGDLKLRGDCNSLQAKASGGADLSARDLHCKTADVTASGGADLEVWATTSVKAHASGGSDVRVLGSPASVDKSTSGGGDIHVKTS